MPDKKLMNPSRRNLLLAGLALAAGPAFAAPLLTPRQSTGPFYPPEPPLDDDNDLTRVKGRINPAKGEIADLTGRILDSHGHPIKEARIEIWQCDANGRYIHPGDKGGKPRDPGFQGFGAATSDAEGRYRFRTIKPVPYPGRTPHIHIAVYTWAHEPFVTQMYIAGHPLNRKDFLFNRIPNKQQPLVEAKFIESSRNGIQYTSNFDIILAGSEGTPSVS